MSKRHTARKYSTFRVLVPLYICLVISFAVLIKRGQIQLLEPAGYIANIQSKLLWGYLVIAAVVGTSIIITFFFIVFRYREGTHRRYDPTWVTGKKLQLAAWGIPFIAICFISALVWNTAHLVDPYRPINSTTHPITIQVVALRWKWLFLYPNDHIASVNMMEIPVGTPISLQLTADAPMNSFWIPRLSGQVYAMTGMVTQLHIEADQAGDYAGSPAEMSGDGFSGMDFTVKAVSAQEYAAWQTATTHTSNTLNYSDYLQLAQPSSYVSPQLYKLPDSSLFLTIVMQFMTPGVDPSTLQVGGKRL